MKKSRTERSEIFYVIKFTYTMRRPPTKPVV